jgi:hypothetical protein
VTLDGITCLPYNMGLDPNYAPDEIQRIKNDAPIVDTQDPSAFTTAPFQNPLEREKITSNQLDLMASWFLSCSVNLLFVLLICCLFVNKLVGTIKDKRLKMIFLVF